MAEERPGPSCEQIKPNGKRCRAPVLIGSTYCFCHSPEKVEERAAARRSGGVARTRRVAPLPPDVPLDPPIKIKNAAQVLELLSTTIGEVKQGVIDPKVANSIGFLSSIALKVLEQTDLEEQLQALEALVNKPQSNADSAFQADAQDVTYEFERPEREEDDDKS